MADVDTSQWDGPAAMSAATNADDPAAAYAAICAGRRDGDPALQASWALPHHKAPGDPPNADGVRNALSRLPQTDGLNNAEAAHTHLENHLADVQAAEGQESTPVETLTFDLPIAEITLSQNKRRMGLKIAPWGVVANSKYGPIMFERGAFVGLDGGPVDPKIVRLRMDHTDPPTGLGEDYQDKPDAAYMDFGVSRTSRGDDQIALALDGTSAGASVGMAPYKNRHERRIIDGVPVLVFPKASAVLAEVSTTWQPTFGEAGVQYVLHLEEKGDGPVAEAQKTPDGAEAAPPAVIQAVDTSGIEKLFSQFQERVEGRLERIEETRRQEIVIPKQVEPAKPALYQWASAAIRLMGGDRVSARELQTLALDDVITDENPGLVPPAYKPELLVEITQGRPFLASTNEFPAPDVGMSITVPVIEQEPTTDVQANEKTDISSTALHVGLDSFDAITIAGGADVSIQMLKRATNTFLDLFVRRLAEAYARNADAEALDALLAATVSAGTGTLDPEDLTIGEAWANAITNYGKAPDTMWLSSDGVQEFIDAKANTTNQPLYANLAGAFTVAGGTGGNISGLRPVYVPALDATAVDVLIGPSRAFAWAEDGTYTLRADNPSKAGQDIALVGMMFFVPEAPLAFTSYAV